MEQSSLQPGKLSSHPSMCVNVCVWVCVCGGGCRKKARKKACECPTAYKHTTHTHYPHVLDPYICILFTLHLLYLSFHFSPLFSHLHTCAHTQSFTHTHVQGKLVSQGQSLSLPPTDSSREYIVIFFQSWSNKVEQRENTHTHFPTHKHIGKHTPYTPMFAKPWLNKTEWWHPSAHSLCVL